ncbi:unnamed protein product [Caretta caretta]
MQPVKPECVQHDPKLHGQRRILDGSLGFAAGVMLAASYWSLLAPAIELAEDSGNFGAFAFFPVAVGFTLGAAFVYLADLLLPLLGISEPPHAALSRSYDPRAVKEKYDPEPTYHQDYGNELSIRIGRTGLHSDRGENGEPYQRRKGVGASQSEVPSASQTSGDSALTPGSSSWRRIMLLILAVTIHNIPEGLAVGVGFGAVGKSASATFESARFLPVFPVPTERSRWDSGQFLLDSYIHICPSKNTPTQWRLK